MVQKTFGAEFLRKKYKCTTDYVFAFSVLQKINLHDAHTVRLKKHPCVWKTEVNSEYVLAFAKTKDELVKSVKSYLLETFSMIASEEALQNKIKSDELIYSSNSLNIYVKSVASIFGKDPRKFIEHFENDKRFNFH